MGRGDLRRRSAILASHLLDNVESMTGWDLGVAATRSARSRVASAALAAGLAAWAGPSAGETMVRYAHPVWHNGHRVLYHGLWRGGARPSHARVSRDEDDS